MNIEAKHRSASTLPRRTEKSSRKGERPVKAASVVLATTMDIADARAAIVQGALAHLEGNEAGVLSGTHPECLHQMRVALRRLRSAHSVFRDLYRCDELAAEMRWMAAQLGAARNWDVFVFETLPLAAKAFPDVEGISAIRRHGMRLRRTAWGKAQRAVACERYQALKRDARGSGMAAAAAARGHDERPADDLRAYAARVLERRYRKVCKRGHEPGRQDWDELHALRIAVKKLRYPVE
ncbi:MAG: CHAD domain-containing protein, partial [Betaproteobacteria bacterium]